MDRDVPGTGPRSEWAGWRLRAVLAGTVYLLVTGLVIWLAPFSTGAQISVLAHTAGGLLFVVPLALYLGPHVWRRFHDRFSHLLLLGWMAGLLMLAVVVSGVVLTVQAAFGRAIDYGWDVVHTVTGCAVAVILLAHLLTAVRRGRGLEPRVVRRMLAWTSAAGVVLAAATFGAGAAVPAPGMRAELPEGYGFRYGSNPFAPSLARTDRLARVYHDRHWVEYLETLCESPGTVSPDHVADFLEGARRQGEAGDAARIEALDRIVRLPDVDARRRALDALHDEIQGDLERSRKRFEAQPALRPEALAGSRSCGTAGCHEEILAEWEPSAHRYASRSAFFQLIQGAMAESNGAESTRYCAGCHDPISLFSGAKNVFFEDLSSPGADEGISCAVCHSMVRTDVQGNANYVLAPPERYLAEDSFIGRFLIRSYPRHHKKTFKRPLLSTPEYCGACHKQFIDKEINRATRVQLQNQYDAWKGSHWFVPDPKNPQRSDAEKSLACRDCHMRQVQSDEPAATSGKHRHHGFIAANQWLPLFHDLPHAEEHVRLTEEWLKGETVIPEIADRWPAGPLVPLRIEAPRSVRAGDRVVVRVVADNRKVGHTFPTGPLDVIQAWIEVTVRHGDTVLFHSGGLDEKGFIEPGSWMLKAEGVDRAGNLIDQHNLWDMVGARFRRVLFPGYSDREEYTFECACEEPTGIRDAEVELEAPERADVLDVEAVLHYRKVDQTLLNVLLPHGNARAPVTDMTKATARIRIERAP